LETILKTENLTHIYGKGTPFEMCALDNVCLEIEKGDFLGVIGHTGSGKSTLISHFNGLLKPTNGKIYLDGQDISQIKNKSQLSFDVGLVFQYPEYQLFEETVYKDIAFGPSNMGLSNAEITQRVYESLKFVGLDESVLEKSPFELSGGQKRRVAIAGVIAMKPKVLILDEPTAGLDPVGRDDILQHIKDYHTQNNSTVILVSHSMEDIARNAKHILVMNKSKVYMYDTVANIFKRAEELYQVGLAIPQITQIFLELNKRGIDVNTGIYTIEDGKNELLKLIKRRGANV